MANTVRWVCSACGAGGYLDGVIDLRAAQFPLTEHPYTRLARGAIQAHAEADPACAAVWEGRYIEINGTVKVLPPVPPTLVIILFNDGDERGREALPPGA